MSVVNMSKNIKQVHPNFVVCYKVGNFYQSFDKDVYILSDIFGYKIKRINSETLGTGFPQNALAKVEAKLEKEKINYIIIDTRNNYNVDEKEDFRNLNTYNEKFEKAHKSVNFRLRIDKISEELLKERNVDKIRLIESIVYENRKI